MLIVNINNLTTVGSVLPKIVKMLIVNINNSTTVGSVLSFGDSKLGNVVISSGLVLDFGLAFSKSPGFRGWAASYYLCSICIVKTI